MVMNLMMDVQLQYRSIAATISTMHAACRGETRPGRPQAAICLHWDYLRWPSLQRCTQLCSNSWSTRAWRSPLPHGIGSDPGSRTSIVSSSFHQPSSCRSDRFGYLRSAFSSRWAIHAWRNFEPLFDSHQSSTLSSACVILC